MVGKSRLLMKKDYAKSAKSGNSEAKSVIPYTVVNHLKNSNFIFATLLLFCGLLLGCSSSDNDIKAIWSYEQNQVSDPDFQFYPLETKTLGQITVKDSLAFIEKSLEQPVSSLLKQNSQTLKELLQMQTLYVKYDMETLRENLSLEIGQLESSQKWLNGMKARIESYRSMSPDKVLVRRVECRFQYTLPLSSQKAEKDKIYFIHATTGHVILAQDKPSGKTGSIN
ncbi:MAG: hypothetical protein H6Q17_1844 [Bacteroidetes bacterium]|nr:hypothetical protein [Bacteroidota bacterium]